MTNKGYAQYNAGNNTLEVIRPGEQCTRIIRCSNLYPESVQVFAVEVDGNEVLVYVGPHTNRRPTHVRVYSMLSLTGGQLRSI